VLVTPKDFSPLALRTPLHVRGSFANPVVSVEKSGIGARLGAAALLSFLNPLAALIPLIDIGNSDDAERGASNCRALSKRIKERPALPAPKAARAAS
jgi:AsmA family protein